MLGAVSADPGDAGPKTAQRNLGATLRNLQKRNLRSPARTRNQRLGRRAAPLRKALIALSAALAISAFRTQICGCEVLRQADLSF